MTRVVIIGAGLFGAVLRDTLRARGVDVIVVDDQREGRGSYPAGCLVKPSWLNSLGKDGTRQALAHLDELYGLRSIPIRIGPMKLESIQHVNPDAILQPPDVVGTVVEVDPDQGRIIVEGPGPGTSVYRIALDGIVVVAAGIWCKSLLPDHFAGVNFRGMAGVSLRYFGSVDPARLKVWAPYKQSIAFNIRDKEVWFGDGTSVLDANWHYKYVERAMQHAKDLDPELNAISLCSVRVGIRPVIPKHAGWCKQVGQRCWVSTGGGKNGVALAALQSLQIAKEIAP